MRNHHVNLITNIKETQPCPLYEDEALSVVISFLDHTVKDYINPKLRLSRLTAEREHWLTAKEFLHEEISILWGDKYFTLTDLLSFTEVKVDWFLEETEDRARKALEVHMQSKLRRRRKGPRAYLAGPMEYIPDGGTEWRTRLAEELKKLGIQSLLPQDIEKDIIPNKFTFDQLKRVDTQAYKEKMRKLIDADIGLVENADLFICKYEGERSSGIFAEATYAYLRSIPTYLITHLESHQVPGWFLGCFDHEVADELELIAHLEAEIRK